MAYYVNKSFAGKHQLRALRGTYVHLREIFDFP
jgi:hypothetical protein